MNMSNMSIKPKLYVEVLIRDKDGRIKEHTIENPDGTVTEVNDGDSM